MIVHKPQLAPHGFLVSSAFITYAEQVFLEEDGVRCLPVSVCPESTRTRKSRAYSWDPKNRMFPCVWNQEDRLHASVCSERTRVGGLERKRGRSRLSSPAYRSTKDNLTLPLGFLPRLPTWHSFYFCTSPLRLLISPSVFLSLS